MKFLLHTNICIHLVPRRQLPAARIEQAGIAPDMDHPWANASRCWIARQQGWDWIVDEDGCAIADEDVQLARVVEAEG